MMAPLVYRNASAAFLGGVPLLGQLLDPSVELSDGLTEPQERQTLLQLIQSRPRNAKVFCIVRAVCGPHGDLSTTNLARACVRFLGAPEARADGIAPGRHIRTA